MKVDYLIIGSGLAGIAFAETCLKNNKSIFVINNTSQNSTSIAGGLYNAIILKRFTKIWEAEAQLETAIPFYTEIEKKLNERFLYQIPLLRKLNSIEEQNNWFVSSDKTNLKDYLQTDLEDYQNKVIPSEYKFGKVNQTGYLDTTLFQKRYQEYLTSINCHVESTFDYEKLIIEENQIQHKDIKANQIIFAEGFGLQQNPFFNNLPLDGTKGELLQIESENLKLENIINSSLWILPLGNNQYKVGATYNWVDKTKTTTETAKQELLNNIKDIIKCDFKVIKHLAGVRPTVKDRKPLVGQHFQHKNLYLLNGLGTRGVLFAPYLADKLYNLIENGIELDNEISVKRIYKKLQLL